MVVSPIWALTTISPLGDKRGALGTKRPTRAQLPFGECCGPHTLSLVIQKGGLTVKPPTWIRNSALLASVLGFLAILYIEQGGL